jgi:hypothetical protein
VTWKLIPTDFHLEFQRLQMNYIEWASNLEYTKVPGQLPAKVFPEVSVFAH